MTTSAPTLTAPSTPILFADARYGADDPRHAFARAATLLGAVIDAVRPEHLDQPTPCAEHDVDGLLHHIAALLPRVALIGRGESFAGPARIEGDVALDEWAGLWRDGAREVEDVWSDDATLAQTVVLPWATESGAQALAGYVNELTVHTWDLSQAIGVTPAWDDEVVAIGFESIRHNLPAVGRTELFERMLADVPPAFRPAAPFAEAVEVAPDAPLIDRVVAWNGRHPS